MRITPALRPRLRLEVPLTPEIVTARVERRLRRANAPCTGLVIDRQIDLRIHPGQRHYWSPQLTILVRSDDAGSALTGHLGPNANIWTMFMAAYATVVISALGGLFYGMAQATIGETPWALVSVPAALLLVGLLYASAGVGQRLGHDQVDVLVGFLEAAIEDEEKKESG